MPLFEMSTNVQESDAAFKRRSHDQLSEATLKAEDVSNPLENNFIKQEDVLATNGNLQDIPSVSITHMKRERSSSPTVTSDSDSSLSERDSPSPIHMSTTPSTSPLAPGQNSSPSKPPTSSQATDLLTSLPASSTSAATMPSSTKPSGTAAVKRKRKTPAEKEAEDRERAQKKAKRDEELAAKAKEREDEKAAKEAVKTAKAAEKAKIAAEKEEKIRRQKEEEDKKKRAQPSIFGFLKKPSVLGDVSPNKQSSSNPIEASPVRSKPSFLNGEALSPSPKESKPQKSAYEKLFQDFFIKPDVTMAPTPFEMDDEARAVKSRKLDEYIHSDQPHMDPKPFDPDDAFQLNGLQVPRGIEHPSVKVIVAQMFSESMDENKAATQTESQLVRHTNLQTQLDSIPVKVLRFFEDVRPPYVGTITSTTKRKLRELARRPAGRLLPLRYDYDSEAEWEEEEGEDLDDEEIEDEENDGEEEMADFLDDADDVTASRPAFLGESEPVSTGICYENRKRLALDSDGETCATVYKYRMEFLLDTLEHHHSIDPFSTAYWKPKVTKPTQSETACTQSKLTSVAKPAKSGMAPPPPPSGTTSSTNPEEPDWSTLVPKNLIRDFKKAVVSTDINFLTKAGIVDMLSKRFANVTKNQVKSTLDYVAERTAFPGEKKSAKRWVLKPEHALNKD